MSNQVPRLRMFAGPNGSGKSELKAYLPKEYLGVYLNPDDIEKTIRTQGYLDFTAYELSITAEEAIPFFQNSELLKSQSVSEAMHQLQCTNNRLDFSRVSVDSYIASTCVQLLRQKLLTAKISFTFETVMSHPSKVDFLATARQAGFRIYLYYIATDDPEINISRVHNRVQQEGHPVPKEKIQSRYYRSLDLLIKAVRNTDRAYVFDNSTENKNHKQTWLAEITGGKSLELKTDSVPAWFKKYVMDKATS